MSGSAPVLAVVLTGAGVVAAVLLGVWRIVRFEVGEVRRDLGGRIADLDARQAWPDGRYGDQNKSWSGWRGRPRTSWSGRVRALPPFELREFQQREQAR